ncbi:MAG: hypothetical protein A2504_03010 [Bdellovibrionales bacterium RIFOXYD12_FULL_39_22]|nr:MAG: hypothetical protein A2385_05725 [Bdellovibrionales bacterium RIFOXYB1_FULL_39_21]OFZ42252.1 MAG: hypothetical protein A2485_15755 [Bdellovibrionales bacterium RIFOXYC12_FULL_39_17]OFZ46656.1 MAG: hypothetical protein A2404_03915 [Bdellovibrionales bacterium RIFOXYC1_FULL_39_130]OFZ76067.1 MAG: hypothetical protein A2560_03235 [Bdellovibrionales bacterium RIFOXYD1_FULL_39_84]OFZ93051.1 MAG: hypothetical protein A2504_03010 [Bdellovibrionales bacterium RIFOXYD12_FULL_39_22]HLE09945.1 cy
MKYIIILLSQLFTITLLFATPSLTTLFIAEYPFLRNSKLHACTTCHMPVVKDSLNSYGLSLRASKMDFKAVEDADSDLDTKKNIDELNDKAFPGSHATYPEYFIFTNKKGNIDFNHEMHVAAPSYLSSGNCDNCHDAPNNKATDLFLKRFDDNISLRSEGHRLCWRCHRESGSANAPVQCGGCHQ